MAFTGRKHKGSKILTPETVRNHDKLYDLLNEIKEFNPKEDKNLRETLFEQMFYHLSHSAQKEILEWADRVNWNVCVMDKKSEDIF